MNLTIGRKIYARDKTKWRSWGVITKTGQDTIELFTAGNPEGYKTRQENVSDIIKWSNEGLLK